MTIGSRVGTRSKVAVAATLAAAVVVVGWLALRPTPTELPPWDALGDRWGTYLGEREWGNPREAVGGDGWGLTYLDAVRADYRHGEDGIAGIADRDGTFHMGWAVWDGEQPRVAERLFGWTNAQGDHGEEIVDRRTFGENTPTSSYHRSTLVYPNSDPRYEIDFIGARADATSGVLCATAANTSDAPAALDLVFKAWFHDSDLAAQVTEHGLTLAGPASVLAIAADDATSAQVDDRKGAIDRNLRETGALVDAGSGHIGALAFHLELEPSAEAERCIGWAEDDAEAAAEDAAADRLAEAAGIQVQRRDEAATLFAGEVTAYETLYRQALMSVLWNQSLYRWNGETDYAPEWAGRVDARDVLIMPDKWEFPWLASWDTAFHAVTAALIDPDLGADQLRFVLSDRWQQPDGHIPCAEWVMDAECPPLFAWSAWRVHQAGAGVALLDELWPSLERHYDYWWRNLQVDDSALFTGGFLGMDNLPDRALGGEEQTTQADASAWMAHFAAHMALIADARGDRDAAGRYTMDRDRIAAAVNAELWNEDLGIYLDRRADGDPVRTPSYSGLVPLIAGIVPEERREILLDQLRDEGAFLSPAGIRSVSAGSVLYRPGYADQAGVNSNWRGPVWLPINYLLADALDELEPAMASDLRRRVVAAVEADWQATGRFHEYFDAETGEGLGADAQAGWTALVANLIVEEWPAD